jgi:hypothetical protein
LQVHFSTVVWGPWHTAAFLEVNLPSLLAPGNLPAFAARHKILYRIFTSPPDARRITASAAFRRAQQIATFELVEAILEHPAQPIAVHHMLWRRSAEMARADGAMVLYVPPDVAWSNGSLGHVADVVAQGKRIIFMSYLRVVHESCVPVLQQLRGGNENPVIDMSSRDMVALALRHIHPLAVTYLRDSGNFPVHPEMILWPVGGEGLLMRVLVRELFACDPKLVNLNRQALVAHELDPGLTHIVTDSDDLFSVSLAPALQDIEWYMKPQLLEPFKIASWWLAYDSPVNDMVAARHFHIHPGPRTPALWKAVERQSDALIRKLAGLREMLRVLGEMRHPKTTQARRVLALAVASTRIGQRLGGRRQPLTLFLPRDPAVVSWLMEGGDALLQPKQGRALIDLILDHAIEGATRLKPDCVVTTLGGRQRQLRLQEGSLQIDGVRLEEPAHDVGPHRAYIIDGVLPRAARL